jgi:SAM-dependent methyltransferase
MGVQEAFQATERSAISRRVYRSYTAYLAHQKSKLTMLNSGGKYGTDGTDLAKYDKEFREVLRQRLATLGFLRRGTSVLCLAARVGTEVKAFLDIGCFAVGIDLNPGEGNSYVLPGDFHSLVFPKHSIDVVYTNSLDHAFDLGKVLVEVQRVLKPAGHLIAEVQLGLRDGGRVNTGRWESVEWASVHDLESEISQFGYAMQARARFVVPWEGFQVVYEAPKHCS